MTNDQKITFRCKGNHKAPLFTPQYLHDVDGMRKHQEYEEVRVNDAGEVIEVVTQFEEAIHRPTFVVEPAPAPAAPKKRKAK